MINRKPRGYWTLERVLEEAEGCSTIAEFRKKNQSAHGTAYRNGWMSAIPLSPVRVQKLTQEMFVSKATKIHHGKYDYTHTKYEGTSNKLKYLCPVHGEQEQEANSHLQGHGCEQCSFDGRKGNTNARRVTQEQFVYRAKEKHGDKYDYSDTVFSGVTSPVTYWCREHEKKVTQVARSHLDGAGCPDCGKDRAKESNSLTLEEVKRRIFDKHGSLVTILSEEYLGWNTPIPANCEVHGPFEATVGSLLNPKKKPGCFQCGNENNPSHQPTPFSEFLVRAKKLHGEVYLYDEKSYSGIGQKLGVYCKTHKYSFSQFAYAHLRGQGCPKCAASLWASQAEKDISGWLEELGVAHDKNDRNLTDSQLEADIVIPDHRLVLEHNGLFYHSEWKGLGRGHHKRKTDAFLGAGYSTIHIWGDEWKTKQAQVKDLIAARIGIVESFKHARKCQVFYPSVDEAREFLGRTHIQGFVGSEVRVGLKDAEGIQAIALFGKTKAGEPELKRYSTSPRIRLRGGLSRLVKAWHRETGHPYLVTFCDLSKFTGKAYLAAGFEQIGVLPPDYYYTDGAVRRNKQGFRLEKLAKQWEDFDPSKTERENAEAHGWYRIWDCGKTKFRVDF